MLLNRIRPIVLMIAGAGLWAGCQLPTTPSEPLPFDTRPRITGVVVEAPAPAPAPAPVNVTGAFFLEGLSLTVTGPDARLHRFEGSQIRDLTGSSFDVRVPLLVPGVYYFSVQNTAGVGSQTFALSIGLP